MLNMGGPATVEDVGPFLRNLFTDNEIVQLGRFQQSLGSLLAKRRTPRVAQQYSLIGGSPIRKWTELQGEGMIKLLDEISPSTAPHKHYIAFRYTEPSTEVALNQMKADGVTRAVAFSQYPQFSCTTSGSSFNQLWRELKKLNMENVFRWSLIDRWPVHELYIQAIADQVQRGLKEFSADDLKSVCIIFSAHSLPLKIVDRGDQYPQEIAATVQSVMKYLNYSHPYSLAWQSQVGPVPWMTPATKDVLGRFGKQGHKNVLLVPLGFTSDHIETLYELDIDYAEVGHQAGISHLRRAPSLNDSPLLIKAQAELVRSHLVNEEVSSNQYQLQCSGCVNALCRSILNPIKHFASKRDQITQQKN